MRTFVDKEIKWFYIICVGLPSFVPVLAVLEGEWIGAGLLSLVLFTFLIVGWPLSAMITPDGDIIFRKVLSQTKFTSQNLVRVKCIGARDYRAHIVLRTKYGLPIGYRCRQYTDAPELARAVLNLIERSSDVTATDDAIKLLKQVAKGKTKPLPVK